MLDSMEVSHEMVYPFTLRHHSSLGGLYFLFAHSLEARQRWKREIEEAVERRRIVQETNKLFQLNALTNNLYKTSPRNTSPQTSGTQPVTGQVTTSVSFSMCILFGLSQSLIMSKAVSDGRKLIAIGCDEGVWIGLRHMPQCGFSQFQRKRAY